MALAVALPAAGARRAKTWGVGAHSSRSFLLGTLLYIPAGTESIFDTLQGRI